MLPPAASPQDPANKDRIRSRSRFVARQSGWENASIRMRIDDRNEFMMCGVIVAGKD
jgi:hypothetical protein